MNRRRSKSIFKKEVRINVILLAFIMALCMAISSFLTYKAITRESEIEALEEEMVEDVLVNHNYDFKNLVWRDYFVSYSDANYDSVLGIDVSYHQGEIDWAKVKEAGVKFAFIRVGYRGYEYGIINKDVMFDYNIQNAIANDIKVGVYFFSQAISVDEARDEVDFVLENIKDYQIDLPVVFDMEEEGPSGIGRVKVLIPEEKTKIAVTWMHRIRNAGYEPMYYGSSQLLARYFDLEYLTEFPLWVAEYGIKPRFDYEFNIWQYSASGEIDGIEKLVDLDILFVPKGETLWGIDAQNK